MNLAGRDDFEQAIAKIEQAIALRPEAEHESALDEYREAHARQLAERERKRALDSAVEKVSAAVEAQDVPSAQAHLGQAENEFGANEASLVDCRARISELEAELERRALREAALAAEATIDAEISSGELDEAESLLLQAREKLGNVEELQAVDGRLQAARAAAAEELRRIVEAKVADIDVLVGDDCPDDAQEALSLAREELGPRQEFDAVETRIAELRVRLEEEKKKREQVADLVSDAQRMAMAAGRATISHIEALPDASDIEASVASLEEAVRLDPDDEGLRTLLEHLRTERNARRLMQAVQEVRPKVDAHLEQSELDAADGLLAELRSEHGGSADLDRLVAEVAEARLELELDALAGPIEAMAKQGGWRVWVAKWKLRLAIRKYGEHRRLLKAGLRIDRL